MKTTTTNHRDKNKPFIKYEIMEEHQQFIGNFLQSIQHCKREWLENNKVKMNHYLKDELVAFFKKTPQHHQRFFKNLLLAHNKLYSYSAEKGGLNVTSSYYLSEKYTMLIEHTDDPNHLSELHMDMIDEYSDPALRFTKPEFETLSDKVERLIEMNFSKNYTVADLAKELRVHSSHLMRTFKKEKNMTIISCRNQKRISEAKKLLERSNLPIKDIATMLGFNKTQYFSNVFREIEGLSPADYRETNYFTGETLV